MPRNFRFLLFMAFALAVVSSACSSGDDPTATPQLTAPLSFPYIFQGKFTVDGEPGPAGVPVFARLGAGRGPFNNAPRTGEYTNVSIAPQSTDAIGGEITFYLGHPDGSNVQAEETWIFNATSQPQIIDLDLTFPRLP